MKAKSQNSLNIPPMKYKHFTVSHHVNILHIDIILQLYTTMALHSSYITNFHIIQTVNTFFTPYSGLFCRQITSQKGLSGPQKYFFVVLNFMLIARC